MEKPAESSPSTRKSAVRSGLLTGVGQLLQSGAGAGAAVLLAHRFGRTAPDRRLPGRVRRLPRARTRSPVVPAGRRPEADACGGRRTACGRDPRVGVRLPHAQRSGLSSSPSSPRHPIGDALTSNAVSAHDGVERDRVPRARRVRPAARGAARELAGGDRRIHGRCAGLGSRQPARPGRLRRPLGFAWADHARLGCADRRRRDDGHSAGRALRGGARSRAGQRRPLESVHASSNSPRAPPCRWPSRRCTSSR